MMNIQAHLKHAGIEQLKPMQEDAIQAFQQHNNIRILSPTGSGKTLAFLLSIIQNLDEKKKTTQAIILAPARELALQIESELKTLGSNFRSICVYGGHSFSKEVDRMRDITPQIIIATPGRLLDHIEKGTILLDQVKFVVFDEFDKILEFGFEKEILSIVRKIPKEHRQVLCSATDSIELPGKFQQIQYHTLDYLREAEDLQLTFQYHYTDSKDKVKGLGELLHMMKGSSAIVFVNHRESVDRILAHLEAEQLPAIGFHGGLDQLERELAICAFRNGTKPFLISTDLAARGIDVPELDYIIHYHIPKEMATFTHRNGRTARMTASGTVITLLGPEEQLPEYIQTDIDAFYVEEDKQVQTSNRATSPILFNKGKTDKLSKGDILGALTKQYGVHGKSIGRIDILERWTLLAIDQHEAEELLKQKYIEVKGKRVKVSIL